MTSIRVIVCGGRKYSDRKRLVAELDQVHLCTPISFLADGGASGADTIAHAWAKLRQILQKEQVKASVAEWNRHGT